MAKLQGPEVFFPGLTARPWWSGADFPWLAELEAAAPTIRQELLAFDLDTSPPLSHWGEHTAKGDWRALYLCTMGRPYAKNLQAFPLTLKILSALPGASNCDMTFFSSVQRGTHIAAHTGFTNAHLRCHLSLVATEGSRIRVADETRGWREGRAFVFDDTFEHEVWNEGDQRRTVLLFDFWHPELTPPEIEALTFMMSVWRRMYARRFWADQLSGQPS
ncbi:aspartyl/asparaginyl beta-hydroxylase domain-containing protein [Nonomuraea sp. NPDC050540]|uniref:aspartyl/asparaginyl beta-hydroxylase domain-containing protein n=1 Tax=Nonomuraea sp. NPDC050540 TaxID=3364367 RepID=UPI00379CF259